MRQSRKNLRPDTQRYAGLQEVTLGRLYKEAGGKPRTSMVSLPCGGGASGGGSRARLRVPEATPWPTAHARCALRRKSRGTPGTPRGTTG